MSYLGYTQGMQDVNFNMLSKAFQAVIHRKYPGQEQMVGAQLWGQNSLGTEGLHDEVLHHTGLIGQAQFLGRLERAPVPMSTYKDKGQVIADYGIYGIGFELFPREMSDWIAGRRQIVEERVGDLPGLLADREEDEHLHPYNEGETFVSGVFEQPIYVDGTVNFLQILSQPGVNYGSNIIDHAGGVSYHLISLIEQYGDNFVNEEGRLAPIRPAMILASPQNARLLDLYYGATTNIEQGNPNIPNPVRYRPTILASHRLKNPNNIHVWYEGWEEDFKERSKFRGWAESAVVGVMNQQKVVNIIRSRFAYYYFYNRRALLVRGLAPNA